MIKKIFLAVLALLVLSAIFTFAFYSSFQNEKLAALEAGSQIAETSAGPIEYQIIGDTGPVLLLLHGTPGGYHQASILDSLLKGFRVLAPSRPGYFRTPLEVGQTPKEQAHAYAALLDSLSIDSVIVMGISGGGPSSIEFSSLYPNRTQALITIEAASQPTVVKDLLEQQPFLVQQIIQSDFLIWATLSLIDNFIGPEGLVSYMIPNPNNQQLLLNDPRKMSQLHSLLWAKWPASRQQAGADNDFIQYETLDLSSTAITVPTLIIHGTEDTRVPYEQSKILASEISGSFFHSIVGADHAMPYSHEEEVKAVMTKFLSALNIK